MSLALDVLRELAARDRRNRVQPDRDSAIGLTELRQLQENRFAANQMSDNCAIAGFPQKQSGDGLFPATMPSIA